MADEMPVQSIIIFWKKGLCTHWEKPGREPKFIGLEWMADIQTIPAEMTAVHAPGVDIMLDTHYFIVSRRCRNKCEAETWAETARERTHPTSADTPLLINNIARWLYPETDTLIVKRKQDTSSTFVLYPFVAREGFLYHAHDAETEDGLLGRVDISRSRRQLSFVIKNENNECEMTGYLPELTPTNACGCEIYWQAPKQDEKRIETIPPPSPNTATAI